MGDVDRDEVDNDENTTDEDGLDIEHAEDEVLVQETTGDEDFIYLNGVGIRMVF